MSEESSPVDNDVPAAKEGKSDEVFEVEKILAHKVHKNDFLLKVRWLGYGEDDDTWEPEQDIKESAGGVVSDYYNKLGVNDKTELIEKLQRSMNRNANKNSKKRSRPECDDDTDSASDSSFPATTKSSAKKFKKRKSKGSEPSSSSRTPKGATKAALKSYDGQAPTTPVYSNNAKKAAMEVRDHRGWLDSSDDEGESPVETEIEKLANKVKEKAIKEGTLVSPKPAQPEPEPSVRQSERRSKSPSQQPCCSSSLTPHKKTNKSKEPAMNLKRTSTGSSSPQDETNESVWKVDGIVRHVDGKQGRKKLVLMTHLKTGEQKVLDTKEAFALDGWALTKYLLDRCEF